MKSKVTPNKGVPTPQKALKKGASKTPATTDDFTGLLNEMFEDSIISSYGHDLAAEVWNKRYIRLGIATTALSAIVSASIFSTYESLALVAGLISLALVVISSIATFLNSEQKFAYRAIGDKVMMLKKMDIPFKRKGVDEICQECEKLMNDLNKTTKDSPRLSSKFWHLGEEEWEEDKKEAAWAKAKDKNYL